MNRDLVTKALRFLCCLALSLLTPSLAFADFPPVATFPNTGFYQARTLQDTNNVTVMELTGNYDMNTSAGVANVVMLTLNPLTPACDISFLAAGRSYFS